MVWIFGKYLIPPINKAMTARQEAIRKRVRRARRGQGRGAPGRGGLQGAAQQRQARGGPHPRGGARAGRPDRAGGAGARRRPRPTASSSTPTPRSRPTARRRSPRCAPTSAAWRPPWPAGSSVSPWTTTSAGPCGRALPRRPRGETAADGASGGASAEALADAQPAARRHDSAPTGLPRRSATSCSRSSRRRTPRAPVCAGSPPTRRCRPRPSRAGRAGVRRPVGDAALRPARRRGRPALDAVARPARRAGAAQRDRRGPLGRRQGRPGDRRAVRRSAGSSTPTRRCATRCPTRLASVEDKAALLDSLLDGKALPATVTLAKQAVAGTYRTVTDALDDVPRRRGGEPRVRWWPRCGSRGRSRAADAAAAGRRARPAVRHDGPPQRRRRPGASSAASASRSATRSSTAPSPAGSTTPAAGSPADHRQPDHRHRTQRRLKRVGKR